MGDFNKLGRTWEATQYVTTAASQHSTGSAMSAATF